MKQRRNAAILRGALLAMLLGLLAFVAVPQTALAGDLIPHMDIFNFTTWDVKP